MKDREDLGPLLFDAGGATSATTKVVELGATDVAPPGHLDLVDARRMNEEGALDPDPVGGQTANCEVLVDPTRATPDDDALEDLDSLPVALDHLGMDAYVVPRAKGRDV